MEVMTLVLPVAVGLAVLAVAVFAWAVRSGQFDDLVTPALRVLVDDEGPSHDGPAVSTPPRSPDP